jgi:hypothetical protein
MDSTIIYAILGVIALVLFLFIAKHLLRLAVRLMIAGGIVVALLAAFGWWNGWFDSFLDKTPSKPAATRRANTH